MWNKPPVERRASPRVTGKGFARNPGRIRRGAVFLGLVLALWGSAAAADDPALSLSGPVRVDLTDGRSFSGRPVSYREEILVVRTPLDGGEVERGFPRRQIARVRFPGERVVAEAIELLDDGRRIDALPRLEALWRQRAGFLALADPEIVELLAALPAAHLEAGDPYRAIALARNLLPHASSPIVADQLHEAVLVAHYRLEFYEETGELARQWIRGQEEFPSSALGWRILAELALLENDVEKVAWIALQPIAISGPENLPHLDGCYALAIHAFHRDEARDRAARLYREMLDRGLAWPGEDWLAETRAFYQSTVALEEAQRPSGPEPDLDLRPPEDDLNLPLEGIRKILRPQDP